MAEQLRKNFYKTRELIIDTRTDSEVLEYEDGLINREEDVFADEDELQDELSDLDDEQFDDGVVPSTKVNDDAQDDEQFDDGVVPSAKVNDDAQDDEQFDDGVVPSAKVNNDAQDHHEDDEISYFENVYNVLVSSAQEIARPDLSLESLEKIKTVLSETTYQLANALFSIRQQQCSQPQRRNQLPKGRSGTILLSMLEAKSTAIPKPHIPRASRLNSYVSEVVALVDINGNGTLPFLNDILMYFSQLVTVDDLRVLIDDLINKPVSFSVNHHEDQKRSKSRKSSKQNGMVF